MSLSRRSCEPMKLTAFRLDEVEADRRPGVFRHARGLRARLARLTRGFEPEATPEPEPDHFVWHAVEDLLPEQR